MEAVQLDGPVRTVCAGCGADVLAVELRSGAALVEVDEILPRHRCKWCAQVAGMGHRRSSCDKCYLTGWIGEPLPPRGVAIDPQGKARIFRGEGDLRHGDAAHMLHQCHHHPH